MTAGQELKPGTGDGLAGGGGRNPHSLHQGLGIVEAGRGMQMPSQNVKGKVSREKPGPDGHAWGTPVSPKGPRLRLGLPAFSLQKPLPSVTVPCGPLPCKERKSSYPK